MRISTPPVREASTNPSAATVLPAPVACSNQKRAVGVGILGLLLELDVLVELVALVLPVLRLLVLVVGSLVGSVIEPSVGVLVAGIAAARAGPAPAAADAGRGCRCAVAVALASASSAVSVPDSASTWWAESTVPSARWGSSSDSSRSSPSSSENWRRHSIDGCSRPASSSVSAASSARRRAEPGASASSSVSPS